jgi:hypothetical protein
MTDEWPGVLHATPGDIATCVYYTGMGPFTNQEVFVAKGLPDRKMQRALMHYHSVANPAKGEKAGERGLPNEGYRPGRKLARRQDEKHERRGHG